MAMSGVEYDMTQLLTDGSIPSNPRPRRRSYRPRNRRSCDFCRLRKTACNINQEPPCSACQSSGRPCTFADRPQKRKRSDVSHGEQSTLRQAQTHRESIGGLTQLQSLGGGANQTSPGTTVSDTSQLSLDLAALVHAPRDHAASSLLVSEAESLDSWPSKSAFLLGDTGESDPYLLRHFSTDRGDQNRYSEDTCWRHYTDQNLDDRPKGRPLVMCLAEHSLYDRGEPRIEDSVLRDAHSDVDSMCNDEVGTRLVKLYFRYVYQYFPIISRSQVLYPASQIASKIRSLPLSLRASLYAAGLPFLTYDDILATTLVHSPPSQQRLYRIAWLAITHEIHTPHLATLQSCLLLLQRVNDDRYVMDTAFRWSLLGWTVSLAQSLGLSTDCENWSGMPAWEKRLRRRLWWAVYVMDKWSFMSAGLPSHIRSVDFDVSPLSANDFTSWEEENRPTVQSSEISVGDTPATPLAWHFHHLVQLSIVLADILDSFFTVSAASKTRCNLALSLDLAKPLRARLKQWKDEYDVFAAAQRSNSSLLTPRPNLDGNASLGLAYPFATIILFRALLRPLDHLQQPPISTSSTTDSESARLKASTLAVRTGARACCYEAAAFVESLQRNVWDAFWHSWSRAGFATVSSLMMRLLITSESREEIEELNRLIVRWRWALRTGGGSAGNVLMSLALLRLDRSLVTKGIHESDEGE